ncbi:peptidase domain-containing ABC transporter [Vibrio penaeicida]|uniref:peptidase domain-containing ABC transporter n=1 Tax=Vibrio penaeicida TaxID=104609 RepID=UPI002734F31A|nr:peptidase domain-containing ABC transporter [Vibrio penaeicida]MDP2575896.1 peptidase domain-containing ABC transporter [Vibrio penaeicida]
MSFLSNLNFSFKNKLPVYYQSEVAECGLTCIAMIATYHGYKTDIDTLRQRFPLSQKGTGLNVLIDIASTLKLSTRPLQLDMEHLTELKLPALLHWNFDHYVVLKSVGKKHCIIHDPALGEQKVSLEQVSEQFTGVALEFMPAEEFEEVNETTELGIRHLWSRIQGLLPSITQILALTAFIQIFALLTPYFIQLTIDEVITTGDSDLLMVLGIAFVSLHLFRAITFALRSWVVTFVATQLNYQLSNNLFTHLIRLPADFFAKRHIGDITSRFSSLDEVNRMLSTGFVEAFIDGVMMLTAIGIMYYYNASLANVVMIMLVAYVALRTLLFRPIRRAVRNKLINQAKEDSYFLESIRAIQTVKCFGHEAERVSGWQNRYADQMNASVRSERLGIIHKSADLFITGVEHVLIIWIGSMLVMDHAMTIGMLYAFLNYRQMFSDQSRSLVEKWFEFRMLKLHLSRVTDIVIAKKEEHVHSERAKLEPIKGGIKLENIAFRYSPNDDDVIDSFDLEIQPGESVVLTGNSGCGKSTLMRILTGLDQPTKGKVLVDDIPLQHMGLAAYRDDIATVMQDDQLLSGTILDNITMFDKSPNLEQVGRAASLAAIGQEIMKMPLGFQTLIGDLGSTLSGGQKQRILLARALYKQPKILFLDEATSSLDAENEKHINNVIKEMGITRVSIAHRKETIEMHDRVIKLSEKGQILSDITQEKPRLEALA